MSNNLESNHAALLISMEDVGHLITLHVCIYQYKQGERTPFIVVNITLTVTFDQFVSVYIVPCFIKYSTCLNNCLQLSVTRRQVFHRAAQHNFLGLNRHVTELWTNNYPSPDALKEMAFIPILDEQ
jgi:hypothetical protein